MRISASARSFWEASLTATEHFPLLHVYDVTANLIYFATLLLRNSGVRPWNSRHRTGDREERSGPPFYYNSIRTIAYGIAPHNLPFANFFCDNVRHIWQC